MVGSYQVFNNIQLFRMAIYLWKAGQKMNLQYSFSDCENVGLQLL